jgi:hypothetical protein
VAAVPVGDLVNWLRVIIPMTEMSESGGDTSNSECVGNMQKTTQTPVTIVKDPQQQPQQSQIKYATTWSTCPIKQQLNQTTINNCNNNQFSS